MTGSRRPPGRADRHRQDELVLRVAPQWVWDDIDEILASAPSGYPIRARMALEVMTDASGYPDPN